MADSTETAELRDDLALCWLGQAVAQVLERAAVVRDVSAAVVASVGGDERTRHVADALASHVVGFAAAFVDATVIIHDGVKHVDTLEYLDILNGQSAAANATFIGVLVVVGRQDILDDRAVAACSAAGWQLILTVSETPAKKSDWPWRCSLRDVSERSGADGIAYIQWPLEMLATQCGWRLALEVFAWITGTPMRTGPKPPLFTSATQLPFQLLLLLLRWTHFHPRIVQLLGKKLQRQLQLTPSERVRNEVLQAQRHARHQWVWRYPETLVEAVSISSPSVHRARTSSLELLSALKGPETARSLVRLSDCRLWDAQKQFYLDHGIKAWSSGTVPFGVSSSSFIAAAYARTAVDFLLSHQTEDDIASDSNSEPNCFVWEAASGSCKFLHCFLLHFFDCVAHHQAEFDRRHLVPLVIASDLSDQVLDSRMQMACFQPYLARGQLEFARFDTAEFLAGRDTRRLRLKHSDRVWWPGTDGPLFFMGNYFFDSLRTDVFALTRSPDGGIDVHEAMIDRDTTAIADMELHFQSLPSHEPFENQIANTVFLQIVDEFRENATATSMPTSSLVLFPTEAIMLITALICRESASTDDDGSLRRYPVAFLAGDAGFSFRDAIPSAFISKEQDGAVSLELPQLSPHPDCFCLPVDFEVFHLIFQHLRGSSTFQTAAQTAATLACDTFDVFFGTATPTSTVPSQTSVGSMSVAADARSHASFRHEFSTFTPGDCDLLWGMMGMDGGSDHVSIETQLALLHQTGWDFDLFVVMQWEFVREWQRRALRLDDGAGLLRVQLVRAGLRSWRTYYELEECGDGGFSGHNTPLQVARWFYILQAYPEVVAVLGARTRIEDDSQANADALYLTGLANFHLEEYWTALRHFRKCSQLAPTRLKIQTKMAATLARLQQLRVASS